MKQLNILSALLIASLFTGVFVQPAQALGPVNDTPASNLAALFEPCAFEVGSDAGPLEESSTKQGYTYAHYADDEATLGQFARLVRTHGLLQIGAHGSGRSLVVECYPGTGAGREARDAAFNDYVNGTNLTGNNPDGLTLPAGACIQKVKGDRSGRRYWLAGPRDRRYHGIRLLDACIRLLTTAATNAPLILTGACNSWGLRDDFLNVREFCGYDALCAAPAIRRDVGLLLQRMDGRAAPKGSARPAHGGPAALPDGSRTAFGLGGFTAAFSHLGPGNTTLAPTVDSGDADPSFAPQGRVQPMTTVPGWVIFDTNMRTDLSPALIISAQQVGCGAALDNIRWMNARRIDFDVVVAEGGAEGHLIFAVKADLALSAQNQTRLDGNLTPASQNGVAPNGDDFQWQVACGDPGTIPETAALQANQSGVIWSDDDRVVTVQRPALSATQPISVAVVEAELLMVAAPGEVARGVFQLANLGLETDLAFLEAADLQLDATIIPSTTVTMQPSFIVLAPASRTPVVVEVVLAAGQRSGVYSGAVNIFLTSGGELGIPIQLVVNQTPTLTLPGPQTIAPGQTLTLTAAAVDGDNEPILLYAEPLPDGETESVATFTDHGDGSATLTFTPEPQLSGVTMTIPILASNPYAFDPAVIDGLDYPPHIPHAVQEVTIYVLDQLFLPLVTLD